MVIPSKDFRPARNRVKFEVEASDGGFDLRAPPRNTPNTFLGSSDVASLKELTVLGLFPAMKYTVLQGPVLQGPAPNSDLDVNASALTTVGRRRALPRSTQLAWHPRIRPRDL